MTNTSIPEDIKNELEKTFHLFDIDGNGFIQIEELEWVLTHLGIKNTTEDQINSMMADLDSNKDGKISLDEFIDNMAHFLGETTTSINPQRETSIETRNQLHSDIFSYFSNFQVNQDFKAVRDNLAKSLTGAGRFDIADDDVVDDFDQPDCTPEQKLALVDKIGEMIPDFHLIFRSLSGREYISYYNEAVEALRIMLSVVSVFKTASERGKIKELILQVFDNVQKNNIIPLLINALAREENPKNLAEILRILGYYAIGPDIGIRSPTQRQKRFECASLIMTKNAPVLLVRLLSHPLEMVRETSVFALTCLAESHQSIRDYLLDIDILPPLLLHLSEKNQASLRIIARVTRCIAVLSGAYSFELTSVPDNVSGSKRSSLLPSWDLISPALPRLGYVLFKIEDPTILRHVLRSLSMLMPGLPEPNVSRRIVALTHHQNFNVSICAIQTIRGIIEVDPDQIRVFLNCGLDNAIVDIYLRDNIPIKVVAASSDLIHFLFSKRILDPFLQNTKFVSKLVFSLNSNIPSRYATALSFLKLIIRDLSPNTISNLIQSGVVLALFKQFSQFKTFDQVFEQIYHFKGATYNVQRVYDATQILISILEVGVPPEDLSTILSSFTLQCLDNISNFLFHLDNAGSSVLSWFKTKFPTEEITSSLHLVDHQVRLLLNLILKMQSKSHDSFVNEVRNQVVQILNTYLTDDKIRARIQQYTTVKRLVRSSSSSSLSSSASNTSGNGSGTSTPNRSTTPVPVRNASLSGSPTNSSPIARSKSVTPTPTRGEDEEERHSPQFTKTASQRSAPPMSRAPTTVTHQTQSSQTPTPAAEKGPKTIIFKFSSPSGENRLFKSVTNVPFPELVNIARHCCSTRVQDEHTPIALHFQDEDGDKVSITSNETLSAAIQYHQSTPNKTFKLFITAPPPQTATSTRSYSSSQPPRSVSPPIPSLRQSSPKAKAKPNARDSLRRSGSVEHPFKSLHGAASIVFRPTAIPKATIATDSKLDVHPQASPELLFRAKLLASLCEQAKMGFLQLFNLCKFWKFTLAAKKLPKTSLISKEFFQQGFEKLGFKNPPMVSQMFSLFEKNNKIDFIDFCSAMTVVQKGKIGEKIRNVFFFSDLDENGTIDISEFRKTLKSTLEAIGSTLEPYEYQFFSERLFREIDVDHNGQIDRDEFSTAVRKNNILLDIFFYHSRLLNKSRRGSPGILSPTNSEDPHSIAALLAAKSNFTTV